MSADKARCGTTLVELLVAIVLVTILAAIGGVVTQRVLTVHARTAATDSRRSALADALATLVRHAASVQPGHGDLRVARDTSLEFVHDIGMTTVCRVRGDTLVVTNAADTVPWSATLPRAITTDDELRVWHDADARWVRRSVLAVAPVSGACGDSSLAWPGSGTQQLVLDSSTAGVRPGVVVRVRQRERWSLVRGGDGNWSLSMATWDATRHRFAVPQPLLSPLSPPASHVGPGMVVRAVDAMGSVLPDSALAHTHALLVSLRFTTAVRTGAITDSVRINVAIR
jgi:Tfp pilus assembly protein PilE